MPEEEWGNERSRDNLYLISAPAKRTIDPSKPAKKPGTVTRTLNPESLEDRTSADCRAKGGVTHLRDGVEYCTSPKQYCMSQRPYNGTGTPCGMKSK